MRQPGAGTCRQAVPGPAAWHGHCCCVFTWEWTPAGLPLLTRCALRCLHHAPCKLPPCHPCLRAVSSGIPARLRLFNGTICRPFHRHYLRRTGNIGPIQVRRCRCCWCWCCWRGAGAACKMAGQSTQVSVLAIRPAYSSVHHLPPCPPCLQVAPPIMLPQPGKHGQYRSGLGQKGARARPLLLLWLLLRSCLQS